MAARARSSASVASEASVHDFVCDDGVWKDGDILVERCVGAKAAAPTAARVSAAAVLRGRGILYV